LKMCLMAGNLFDQIVEENKKIIIRTLSINTFQLNSKFHILFIMYILEDTEFYNSFVLIILVIEILQVDKNSITNISRIKKNQKI
jgi:hypothetical protein